MVTVGIPRALLYHTYGLLWERFYQRLGAQVITSPATTKDILDQGVSLCVDDACLPVKIFHGHVAELATKCDFVFVPRIVSVEPKSFICPKFMGLPDMVAGALGSGVRLIDPVVDFRKAGRRSIISAVASAAAPVTRNSLRIIAAFREALREWSESGLERPAVARPVKAKVGLLAHPYTLRDPLMNMGILQKLSDMEVGVMMPDEIPEVEIEANARTLGRHIFWTHGRQLYGAGLAMMTSGSIDGVVVVQAFGCGPGSIIFDMVERSLRRCFRLPTLSLSLDEHTGEAGVITRLEAFVDMLLRRSRHETDVSTSRIDMDSSQGYLRATRSGGGGSTTYQQEDPRDRGQDRS